MAADGDVAGLRVDHGVEVIEGWGIEQVMHEDGSDVVGLFDGHFTEFESARDGGSLMDGAG